MQNIANTIDAGNGQGKDNISLLETFINTELSVKGTFGEKQVARWAKSEYAKKVEAYTGKVDDPHGLAYQDVLNTLKDAHSNKCLYVSSATQNIISNLLLISKVEMSWIF